MAMLNTHGDIVPSPGQTFGEPIPRIVREQYVALYCSAGNGWDFHGFYVDEEAANREIDSVEAGMPLPKAVRLKWRMSIRNADEIRNLMAALDARRGV